MVDKTPGAEAPDNTAMWNRLEPTDPKYTKSFDRGGFKGTATNGTYILKRLTEEFGPCGTGWRFVLDDEQIIDGHTLDVASGDKAKLHIVRGHLEYRTDPKGGGWYATSPQYGQTMLVGKNKNGLFTDEEAPKKSITDCISKCAVLLGIAADVHLGLFDDVKYVNDRKKQEAADSPQQPKNLTLDKAPAEQNKHVPANPPTQPTEDDMAVARQVFSLVKSVCASAKDRSEIDDCLRNNKAALGTLENASPSNFASLKALVEEAHKKLDDPMNDALPDFA